MISNQLYGFRIRSRPISAMTIAEMAVSSAVLSLLTAGLLVGISTLQRTFRASQHHVKSQIEQARIIDYVGRDVRRAKTISVDSYNGHERLNLTIPDYYEGGAKTSYTVEDTPRHPILAAGNRVQYGPSDIAIKYFRNGNTICRSVNGAVVPLVSDVEDFKLEFPTTDSRQVNVQVKFRPRYSFRTGNAAMEDGTLVKSRILLRNIAK